MIESPLVFVRFRISWIFDDVDLDVTITRSSTSNFYDHKSQSASTLSYCKLSFLSL